MNEWMNELNWVAVLHRHSFNASSLSHGVKRDYAVNIIALFTFLLCSSYNLRHLLFIFDVIFVHVVCISCQENLWYSGKQMELKGKLQPRIKNVVGAQAFWYKISMFLIRLLSIPCNLKWKWKYWYKLLLKNILFSLTKCEELHFILNRVFSQHCDDEVRQSRTILYSTLLV